MSLISSPTGLYSLDKAREVAHGVQAADEDGWTYTVVDCENGYGRIDVYDEDNELVVKGFLL